MKKIIFIFVMALMPVLASAQDVYAYKAGSDAAVDSAKAVTRIEFTSAGINLVADTVTAATVALDNVDYLLFYKKEPAHTATAIASIGKSAAGITFDGQNITVSADEPLTSVDIYSAGGSQYLSTAPGQPVATVSAELLPAGVYIVKAIAGGKATVSKILIK